MGSPRMYKVPALAGLISCVLLLTAVNGLDPAPSRAGTVSAGAAAQARPDIVMVLMDDFSMELMQTMHNGRRMKAGGAWYPNAFVVDSMCCVSRASIFTGQYPHQTGVRTNTSNLPNSVGPVGGWPAFKRYGNGPRSFNVRLRNHGYATGFVGKYLNEFSTSSTRPEGWSEWRPVFGDAYDGWDFRMRGRDGGLQRIHKPAAGASRATKDRKYATNVIGNVALDFIERRRPSSRPYFLEVSMFGPHSRVGGDGAYQGDPLFPPAFADRPSAARPSGNCGPVSCRSLDLADLPGFRDDRRDNRPFYGSGDRAPGWRTNKITLSGSRAVTDLRNRARMVQSMDRWLGRLIKAAGPEAYVVLTSDNGFHLGQHSLNRGKGTPYTSDVHVPLAVKGPGVPRGTRRDMVTNIDLAPTFESLARIGTPRYRYGTSFVDSLHNPADVDRDHVFFEHTWARSLGSDPDKLYAGGTMDLIPSYVAVRGRHGLLVRVDLDNRWARTRFAWEFYDYRDGRFERTNTWRHPSRKPEVAALVRKLNAFLACSRATRGTVVTSDCRNL